MPKYEVTRRYAAILEGNCVVDAESEDEAVEKALTQLQGWSDFEDTGESVGEPDGNMDETTAVLIDEASADD